LVGKLSLIFPSTGLNGDLNINRQLYLRACF
jgi:hypothetical protein